MKLVLKRSYRGPKYCIGHLFIDGVYFCDVIEDVDRGLTQDMSLAQIKIIKVYGKTAIPYGTYKVTITYSPKFEKYLPYINKVPGFTGIRIHNGVDQNSSLGCIIVGENKIKGKVINSKATLNKLMEILKTANDIELKITK